MHGYVCMCGCQIKINYALYGYARLFYLSRYEVVNWLN